MVELKKRQATTWSLWWWEDEGVSFAALTCSNERKCWLRGHTRMCNILDKVQSKEIPHEVKHSDLQANMILLANININFMLNVIKVQYNSVVPILQTVYLIQESLLFIIQLSYRHHCFPVFLFCFFQVILKTKNIWPINWYYQCPSRLVQGKDREAMTAHVQRIV